MTAPFYATAVATADPQAAHAMSELVAKSTLILDRVQDLGAFRYTKGENAFAPRALSSAIDRSWNELAAELNACYPALKSEMELALSDLEKQLADGREMRDADLRDWYFRYRICLAAAVWGLERGDPEVVRESLTWAQKIYRAGGDWSLSPAVQHGAQDWYLLVDYRISRKQLQLFVDHSDLRDLLPDHEPWRNQLDIAIVNQLRALWEIQRRKDRDASWSSWLDDWLHRTEHERSMRQINLTYAVHSSADSNRSAAGNQRSGILYEAHGRTWYSIHRFAWRWHSPLTRQRLLNRIAQLPPAENPGENR